MSVEEFKGMVCNGFPDRCPIEGCGAKLPWYYDGRHNQNEAKCQCGRSFVCINSGCWRGTVVLVPACGNCHRRLGPLPDCTRCGGDGRVDRPGRPGEETSEECACTGTCPCEEDLTNSTPAEVVKACIRLHLYNGRTYSNPAVPSLCGGIVKAGEEALHVMTFVACEIKGKVCKGCVRNFEELQRTEGMDHG